MEDGGELFVCVFEIERGDFGFIFVPGSGTSSSIFICVRGRL